MATLRQAYLMKKGRQEASLTAFERAWLSAENEKLVLARIRSLTQFEFRPDEWFLTTMFSTAARFAPAPRVDGEVLSRAREWYFGTYDEEIVQRALDVQMEAVRTGQAYAPEVHTAPIDIRAMYKRQRKGDIPMVGEMMFPYEEPPLPKLNGEEEVADVAWR